jgi:hypothetical protein
MFAADPARLCGKVKAAAQERCAKKKEQSRAALAKLVGLLQVTIDARARWQRDARLMHMLTRLRRCAAATWWPGLTASRPPPRPTRRRQRTTRRWSPRCVPPSHGPAQMARDLWPCARCAALIRPDRS